jgi:hypothetical protein
MANGLCEIGAAVLGEPLLFVCHDCTFTCQAKRSVPCILH